MCSTTTAQEMTQITGTQSTIVIMSQKEWKFAADTVVGMKTDPEGFVTNTLCAKIEIGDNMALKETQVIKKISFFFEGERQTVDASDKGTFRVPVTKVVNGRVKTQYENLTAREIVDHPTIKHCDPVATLKTGEKIRIYDGGDPSYLPAMSEGIIEKHDRVENLRRKFEENKKKLKRKKSSEKSMTDTDEYDSPFQGWGDYDEYF